MNMFSAHLTSADQLAAWTCGFGKSVDTYRRFTRRSGQQVVQISVARSVHIVVVIVGVAVALVPSVSVNVLGVVRVFSVAVSLVSSLWWESRCNGAEMCDNGRTPLCQKSSC